MQVEIWSDVVCPWCYIGKRRFEAALAQFAHRDQVEIVWRSFELDPHASRTSNESLNEVLAKKLGVSPARAAAMNAQVTALAAEEGLDYHLDQARHGNTFDAHRLIHLAETHGLQAAAKERLLRGYFTEGHAISDAEALTALGVEIGLPADEVRSVLSSDAYADDVRADERRAQQLGISGVPFYVIDGTYGISGAQPATAFLSALEQIWAEAHPSTPVAAGVTDAAACEDGSCTI
ncbi:MAG: DsbA family oxidoreductase [Chloroflexi bacterium]|nr:DsbA family oxidoreductase [Chloroflexota bacterium]